jgi:short-subunit dehydrogenase
VAPEGIGSEARVATSSIFKPVTVITGASVGIGAALARVFARNGHEIALVARREKEMTLLATEIAVSAKYKPHVITADLQRSDAPARIAHELLGRGLEPAIVVNNAGFGLHGPAAEIDRAEQLAMIDLNVRALTDLSLRWIDGIVKHKGGILNVASVAGFMPGPHMAVYYASKAYVLSFSEALACELEPLGVRVTVLCPGPVKTEFQMRAGVYMKRPPPLLGRTPEQVAQAGYDGFMAGKRLVIPGFGNKVMSLVPRLLPRGTMLNILDSYQRGRGRRAENWRKPKP